MDKTSALSAPSEIEISWSLCGIRFLDKPLTATQGEHERTMLQRQIEAADQQIDALIYELYGLTEVEIRIVEEATK